MCYQEKYGCAQKHGCLIHVPGEQSHPTGTVTLCNFAINLQLTMLMRLQQNELHNTKYITFNMFSAILQI